MVHQWRAWCMRIFHMYPTHVHVRDEGLKRWRVVCLMKTSESGWKAADRFVPGWGLTGVIVSFSSKGCFKGIEKKILCRHQSQHLWRHYGGDFLCLCVCVCLSSARGTVAELFSPLDPLARGSVYCQLDAKNVLLGLSNKDTNKTNSVAFSPWTNYTDRATATCWPETPLWASATCYGDSFTFLALLILFLLL
jgi:hypothetical protein